MLKKVIIIGSLLIAVLLIIAPNISAINYTYINIKETNSKQVFDVTTFSMDLIKHAENIKKRQSNPASVEMNWTDPDGPLNGGLDDFSDYINLFLGIKGSLGLFDSLKNLLQANHVFDFIIALIGSTVFTLSSIQYFGEALDMYERQPGDNR